MRAELQTCSASAAEQQELPFFPAKTGKSDIRTSHSHIPGVKVKSKKLDGIKAILENHKLITGLAMLVCIPLLLIVAIANIHNIVIIDGVLVIIGGLFGVHLWRGKSSKKEKMKMNND